MGNTKATTAIVARDGAVAQARLERGMSIRDLVKVTDGAHYPVVWHAEQGYPVTERTAKRIADGLGRKVEDLFMIVSRWEADQKVAALAAARRARK